MDAEAKLEGKSPPVESPPNEVEESEEARLERLGRQRPEQFKNGWQELGFCYSVFMAQVITEYFLSGLVVVLPTVSADLNIPSSTQTWPANSFSLVVACFLLPFGRLADMYGGFPVYIAGIIWLAIFALIAGFAQNELMLDIVRAVQGLGPAAYLPSSLMLLGSVYRPGPRMNVIFSIYGACAPLGFYLGIFFAGVSAQYTTWRWYFFVGSILAALTALISWKTIPSDIEERRGLGVKMDWYGAVTISVGLILVVFAITDSTSAPNGWSTPYIYVTLILGLISLALATYVEGWVAEQPLLPFGIFAAKSMKPLLIALLFQYGVAGIYLLYTSFYMTNFMNATPMKLVAWFTPLAAGGCFIASVEGFFLHRVSGTLLIWIAGTSWIISSLLFAIMPLGANFWAYVFPAMLCATIGIDITFSVTNVFIASSLPLSQQGLAGGLINSVVQLGIAFFLGMASIIEKETEKQGIRQSYKYVFWFELACAAVALLLMIGFVKIDKAKSDYTFDERLEMERQRQET